MSTATNGRGSMEASCPRELDAEIRRFAALGRKGKASPSDLSYGTLTLNNYGVFGVAGSTAIINDAESAILGLGRIIDRPRVAILADL